MDNGEQTIRRFPLLSLVDELIRKLEMNEEDHIAEECELLLALKEYKDFVELYEGNGYLE